MTSKTTPLKTRPPKASTEDAMAKLAELEEWTKAPAKEAAAEANDRPVAANPRPRKRAWGPKASKPVSEAVAPWLKTLPEEQTRAIKLMNFKCPVELFAQTRWLAETTYGYTMTRIIIEALQEKNEKMLRDRERPR